MPRRRLSLAPDAWPPELRARFDEAFRATGAAHRRRLEQALGRWLKAARDAGEPPDSVTPERVAARTAGLGREMATAMRQALQAVYPDASVREPPRRPSRTPRQALSRTVARELPRLPDAWRPVARDKLRVGEDALDDGVFVQAWAPDGLKSMLQRAGRFFDFCRERRLPLELSPVTVRAYLDARQAAYKRGEVSPATVGVEMQFLKRFGRGLFPEHDWTWMDPAIGVLKRIAARHPTRNQSRVVDIVELRRLAEQTAEVAFAAHQRARGHKERVRAHGLARTALALGLLVHSPIRIGALARLDLETHVDAAMRTLFLSPQETKDRKRDVRSLPEPLRAQLMRYVAHHRRVVAPLDETRLFLCKSAHLSRRIGDLNERTFGRRVTAHVVRNAVASFIVSEAPHEAALASEVLGHRDARMTETYRARATQIDASRRLANAAEAAQRELALRSTSRGRRARKRRSKRQKS